MPWCGYWGTTGAAYWWVLPLIGLVFMAVMFLACARGFGCMGRRRGPSAGSDEGGGNPDAQARTGCCGPRGRGEAKRA